jgi:maltose-binding protein MalE
VRRAVVLGGSNFHIRATAANKPAALALMKAYLTPYWNVRLGTGAGSQASRASARASDEGKKFALQFSDLVFEMMTYGVNVPLVTQSGQIWNITVPAMIQQVLSGRSSAKEAAATAAGEIKKMMAA